MKSLKCILRFNSVSNCLLSKPDLRCNSTETISFNDFRSTQHSSRLSIFKPVHRGKFERESLAPKLADQMKGNEMNRMSHRINHIHIRKSFWQKLWAKRRQWRAWAWEKIYSGSMKKAEWSRIKWCRNLRAIFHGTGSSFISFSFTYSWFSFQPRAANCCRSMPIDE